MNTRIKSSVVSTLLVAIFAILTTAGESRSVTGNTSLPVPLDHEKLLSYLIYRQPGLFMDSLSTETEGRGSTSSRDMGQRELSDILDDQYAAEELEPLSIRTFPNIVHPHRQHLPTLPYAKRSPTQMLAREAISAVKRGSTLNEVIRRLMAMQGHSFHSGRATRMRFGAGKRKK